MSSAPTIPYPRLKGEATRAAIKTHFRELERRDGRPPSVRELADVVGTTPSTVAYHLRWLVNRGEARHIGGRGAARSYELLDGGAP